MTNLVVLSRALPFPAVSAGGQPIEFRALDTKATFPAGARVYCSTAVDAVDGDMIGRLPNTVGLIANLGVGTDNIDLNAARERNILVSNTPVVTEDTADLAFSLLLAACRRVGTNERFVRAGSWTKETPLAAFGSRVHGKTLGIVGFGAIGQAVARRAGGFGLKTLYFNRTRKPDAEAGTGAEFVASLEHLLERADIVSLHTPLTPETFHLINAERLTKFKQGAVLVNTGRGSLVDEAALVDALKSGRLSAAGLDVFENEPKVHAGLLACENIVLTPHIGSATTECRLDIVRRGIANIVAFLESGKILDRVA